MDECPLCGANCYVINMFYAQGSFGDRFACNDCLVYWPTSGSKRLSAFTNSAMSRATQNP